MKRLFIQKPLLPLLGVAAVSLLLAGPALVGHGSSTLVKPGSKPVLARSAAPAAAPRPQPAVRDEREEGGQYLVIYSTTYGFDPPSAKGKAGPLTLRIIPRKGFDVTGYQLRTMAGASVEATESAAPNKSRSLRREFAPGEYQVQDPTNPAQVFHLTIEK